MTPAIERQVAYKVLNAPIQTHPYPHIFVPEVFPPDFYAEIQANIPDPKAMTPIGQVRKIVGYKERFVMDIARPSPELSEDQRTFWQDMSTGLLSGAFLRTMTNKFAAELQRRFETQGQIRISDEALLVEDITHYALGPHSDAQSKIITVLFYLPKDLSQAHLGTSIYMPKDPNFTCPGGPHYSYAPFDRVATMPFLPNSLFAFVKGDRSFHGVEPVTDPDVKRWLLLYDIRVAANPA